MTKKRSLKWIPAKRKYEPYDLPDGASCYEEDMDKVVPCAQCGRAVTFGDSYTSLEVHTQIGFGYAVCHECYEAEVRRKKEDYYATIEWELLQP